MEPNKDGIEVCSDKCECGAPLRLHTFTFGRYSAAPQTRHYVDCNGKCGRVGDWQASVDEAVASFDENCKTFKMNLNKETDNDA